MTTEPSTTKDAQNTEISKIEVQHESKTIEVPTYFERSDLEAFIGSKYFGPFPESFDVDRVFILNGNVRAERYLGDGTWVEVIYQTEQSAPVFNASELGWVADLVTAPKDGANPGKTVWVR